MRRRKAVRKSKRAAPSRPSSTLFRVVASALMLVLVFGGGEFLARTAGPMVPSWQLADNDGVIMSGHPTRLWGMGTGTRRNGDATATMNANGLRGPIPVVPRAADVQRILVLGDSTWFGHGVNDDQTTPYYLERDLTAAGIKVETVNGAIPGYSTEQSKLILEELGWAMEPTLLLICNLWSDNNVDGFRDADLLRTNQVFRNNPLAKSALFQLAVGFLDRARGGSGGRIVTWTKSSEWPEAKERRVPLQDYAKNLDWMVREARGRGIGAAFVSPANRGLVDNEFPQGAGWDPYFVAQAQVAAWHELPVFSALAALQGNVATTDEDFVDLMHPTAAGHEAIGAAIASGLVAAGWPDKPLVGRKDEFDASALVDDATLNAGGQSAKMSPQGQLFPNVKDSSSPNTMSPADPQAAPGGGAAPAGAPGGSAVVPGAEGSAAPAETGWELFGTVSGGQGTITVAITTKSGAAVQTASVTSSGEFFVTLGSQYEGVVVIATDSAGQSAQVEARKGSEAVKLQLP